MRPDLAPCSVCGALHPPETMHHVGDALICPTCTRTHTLPCSNCGQLIWRDDNAGDFVAPLCPSCREHSYTTCTRCHSVVHNEDAHYREDDEDEEYPYCPNCYNYLDAHGIMDYYYKPAPIFHGDGFRYFGVELEIDGAGEHDDNAGLIQDIANAEHERCTASTMVPGRRALRSSPTP